MQEAFGQTIAAYGLLILAGSIGASGDLFLNFWVKTNKPLWLVGAIILWICAVSSFTWLLKTNRFAFGVAVVLDVLIHSTFAVVFNRFCFGNRFTGWQWVGFLCALAAIVLIGSSDGESVDADT